jgi:hypothetical protein
VLKREKTAKELGCLPFIFESLVVAVKVVVPKLSRYLHDTWCDGLASASMALLAEASMPSIADWLLAA